MFFNIILLLALDLRVFGFNYNFNGPSAFENQIKIIDYNSMGQGSCPNIKQPLCATNGKEFLYFENQCQLEVKNYEQLIQGLQEYFECPLNYCKTQCKPCAMVVQPVCALDIQTQQMETFPNSCEVERKTCTTQKVYNIIHSGACGQTSAAKCPQFCSREYQPICAEFQYELKVFPNQCELQKEICLTNKDWQITDFTYCDLIRGKDVISLPSSTSKCPELCSLEYKQPFSIRTTICQTNTNKIRYYSRNGVIEWELVNLGPCLSDCPKFCTKEYKPLCAEFNNEMRKFHNECEFKRIKCETGHAWHKVKLDMCSSKSPEIAHKTSLTSVNPKPIKNCVRFCSKDFNPVCAEYKSEFRKFPNECVLHRSICETNIGWNIVPLNLCSSPDSENMESEISDLVCATNGRFNKAFKSISELQQEIKKTDIAWSLLHNDDCLEPSSYDQLYATNTKPTTTPAPYRKTTITTLIPQTTNKYVELTTQTSPSAIKTTKTTKFTTSANPYNTTTAQTSISSQTTTTAFSLSTCTENTTPLTTTKTRKYTSASLTSTTRETTTPSTTAKTTKYTSAPSNSTSTETTTPSTTTKTKKYTSAPLTSTTTKTTTPSTTTKTTKYTSAPLTSTTTKTTTPSTTTKTTKYTSAPLTSTTTETKTPSTTTKTTKYTSAPLTSTTTKTTTPSTTTKTTKYTSAPLTSTTTKTTTPSTTTKTTKYTSAPLMSTTTKTTTPSTTTKTTKYTSAPLTSTTTETTTPSTTTKTTKYTSAPLTSTTTETKTPSTTTKTTKYTSAPLTSTTTKTTTPSTTTKTTKYTSAPLTSTTTETTTPSTTTKTTKYTSAPLMSTTTETKTPTKTTKYTSAPLTSTTTESTTPSTTTKTTKYTSAPSISTSTETTTKTTKYTSAPLTSTTTETKTPSTTKITSLSTTTAASTTPKTTTRTTYKTIKYFPKQPSTQTTTIVTTPRTTTTTTNFNSKECYYGRHSEEHCCNDESAEEIDPYSEENSDYDLYDSWEEEMDTDEISPGNPQKKYQSGKVHGGDRNGENNANNNPEKYNMEYKKSFNEKPCDNKAKSYSNGNQRSNNEPAKIQRITSNHVIKLPEGQGLVFHENKVVNTKQTTATNIIKLTSTQRPFDLIKNSNFKTYSQTPENLVLYENKPLNTQQLSRTHPTDSLVGYRPGSIPNANLVSHYNKDVNTQQISPQRTLESFAGERSNGNESKATYLRNKNIFPYVNQILNTQRPTQNRPMIQASYNLSGNTTKGNSLINGSLVSVKTKPITTQTTRATSNLGLQNIENEIQNSVETKPANIKEAIFNPIITSIDNRYKNPGDRGLINSLPGKMSEIFENLESDDSSEEFSKILENQQSYHSEESLETDLSYEPQEMQNPQYPKDGIAKEKAPKFGVYSNKGYGLDNLYKVNVNIQQDDHNLNYIITAPTEQSESSDKLLKVYETLLAKNDSEEDNDEYLVNKVLSTLATETTSAYPIFNETGNQLNDAKREEYSAENNTTSVNKKGEIYNGVVYKAPVYDAPTYNFIYTSPYHTRYPWLMPNNQFQNYPGIQNGLQKVHNVDHSSPANAQNPNVSRNILEFLRSLAAMTNLMPLHYNTRNQIKNTNNDVSTAKSFSNLYSPPTMSFNNLMPQTQPMPAAMMLSTFSEPTLASITNLGNPSGVQDYHSSNEISKPQTYENNRYSKLQPAYPFPASSISSNPQPALGVVPHQTLQPLITASKYNTIQHSAVPPPTQTKPLSYPPNSSPYYSLHSSIPAFNSTVLHKLLEAFKSLK